MSQLSQMSHMSQMYQVSRNASRLGTCSGEVLALRLPSVELMLPGKSFHFRQNESESDPIAKLKILFLKIEVVTTRRHQVHLL